MIRIFLFLELICLVMPQGMYLRQQQYPQFQQYPNYMIPNGGNIVRVQTQRQQCCWIKQCRNGQCQESYACGDSCPNNPNFNMGLPNNMPTDLLNNMPINLQSGSKPNVQPTLQPRSSFGSPETSATEIKCCILKQCGGGQCHETFTCGEDCAKYSLTPKTNPASEPVYPGMQQQPTRPTTKPKPFLPSRNPADNMQPNMDFTPQFDPLPGITLDEKPKDNNKPTERTTVKPKLTSATVPTTKPTTTKPEKCEPASKIVFPDEDDEDYGPTPGYELKHEYTRKKCDKGTCKDVKFKCGQCPDPFDPQFKLYKVRKACFQCYEITCNTPPPQK